MDPLLILLSAGGAAAVFLYLYRREARITAHAQMDAWRQVAEAAGLTETEARWTGTVGPTTSLRGRSGVLEVSLTTRVHRKAVNDSDLGYTGLSNVIVVQGMGHRPHDLTIQHETLGTGIGKALGAREIEIGDFSFDENVYVRGSVPLAHALFDQETRRSVIGLLLWTDASVALKDGALRVEIPDTLTAPRWLAERLTSVLKVARRLSRPADLTSRLAANVRDDPIATVRLRNLKVLVREYPGRPATVAALEAALRDPSLEVRLHAAIALGDAGQTTLLEIAGAQDNDLEAAVAIETLGGRLPREQALEILGRALRSRRIPVARACLGALAQGGGLGCVEPLAKVLSVERGELAEAAARALGSTERPEAEAPLLEALAHADATVSLAAAEALGRTGSADAVAPLRAFEVASRDHALRRAARQAIAAIQGRLTGASPGQLSLSSGEAGQLSLPEAEAGQVSLPADELRTTHGPRDRDGG